MKQIVVNDHDEVIGYKSRDEMGVDDLYRVSALWIFNDAGDILLARRALSKRHDPGKWEGAVAGTVEDGETYLTNILKEAQEEIGLTLHESDITEREKLFLDQAEWKFFCQLFTYTWNGNIEDLIIDSSEVMDVKWFRRDELDERVATHPEDFVSNFQTILDTLL